MTDTQRSGGLDIDDDLEFQRRSWRVQRVGWWTMLSIIAAACAGLFGGGPASHASAGQKGSPLRIEYERFVRLAAPANVTVYIGAGGVRADSTAAITIDREWLANYDIRQVTPEPYRSAMNDHGIEYDFRIDPAGRTARVTFSLETRAAGLMRGRIGLEGTSGHSISQFSFP